MSSGGGLFTNFTKNWKTAEALASSGLSLIFPKAVKDSTAKAALDPLNLGGMSTPEAVDDIKQTTVSTTTEDLDAQAQAAAKAEAERLRKRKGYKETVLTTMSGVLDTPNTLKQTLG